MGNVVMLAVSGALFGWDKALYSILFQFASTQVIKLLDPSGRRATLFIVTRRETAQAVWQQIRDTAVKGSSAYKTAVSQLNKLDSESTITNALSSKLKNNFGVSRTKTTGSGKNKKTTKKDANTYNSEILTAAEKQLSQYQTLHATSLEQEKNYWINVRKHLKSGTEAWYESTKKIQELDTQIYEEKQKKEADTAHARERKLQKTMLGIKKRFGKNAILKGLNLEDGATARERNNQIGGHKA